MSDTLIVGIIGALSGGGFWHLLTRLVGPDRKRLEAEREINVGRYHIEVIDALETENGRLRDRLQKAEGKIEALEQVVDKIIQGELPPEYS